jgi:hypothetical protein
MVPFRSSWLDPGVFQGPFHLGKSARETAIRPLALDNPAAPAQQPKLDPQMLKHGNHELYERKTGAARRFPVISAFFSRFFRAGLKRIGWQRLVYSTWRRLCVMKEF